ncbi:MAG: hypothetical protein KatS3mg076_0506 [Candidatus Binatia bacterium]|nr:MAG: hypothetical protein KatS3mg076_0506 [Candidatus Binatia bacterium]
MRKTTWLLLGTALAWSLGSGLSGAEGIPFKLKSKKVLGDLVPAYEHSDPEVTTLLADAEKKTSDANDSFGNNCIFEKGKFKTIVGKDPQIKMGKVRCGIGQSLCSKTGVPCTDADGQETPPDPADDSCPVDPKDTCTVDGALLPERTNDSDDDGFNDDAAVPSQLCAQIEVLSTIMDEDIDKDGNSTPKTCFAGSVAIHGKTNYSVSQVERIDCKKGNCKGVLGITTGSGDPCPDVDKVTEVRHVRVADGPTISSKTIFGNTLKACCFEGSVVAGGFTPDNPDCTTVDQDLLAEMGTVTQGL